MIADLKPPVSQRIGATPEQIAAFCDRWQMTEFALFSSVLRDDFCPDSDIDVLLTFLPEEWLTLGEFVEHIRGLMHPAALCLGFWKTPGAGLSRSLRLHRQRPGGAFGIAPGL